MPVTLDLPEFPWDALTPFAEKARRHPDGIVDLSIGSPVDPTPEAIRDALSAATDAHAYPQTAGTPAVRAAIADWFTRRRRVIGLTPAHTLPTVGSKEFVAGLPLWLGLGPHDAVVHPEVAYPTYAIGAEVARAQAIASDDPATWPDNTRLVWLNSPGNPDGRVLDVPQLRAAVKRARELGAVIASDECYAEFGWRAPWAGRTTPSILDPEVVGSDFSSVLAVYSLSKQSNLAGYRAGVVAGSDELIRDILGVRKHLGLIPPAPIQAAMVAALSDDAHVGAQIERYRTRRRRLVVAVREAGFRVDRSEAGLYLWITRGEDAWVTIDWLAGLGILGAPGPFYGESGGRHVRIALTATDERIDAAARRLS